MNDGAPSEKRTVLAELSVGRGTKVRVVEHTTRRGPVARVNWYVGSLARTKDFPLTPDGIKRAKQFARTQFDAKLKGESPLNATLGDLWAAFTRTEFKHLRQKSKTNYTQQWSYITLFLGERFPAERLTHDKLDELRTALRDDRDEPLSVRVVQDVFAILRRVYRWAEHREPPLLTRNRVQSYRFKVAKEERTKARDEYSPEERDRMLATMDPMSSRHWRAWVALTLCGFQGARQWEVLHLQWTDLSRDGKDITWRPEWEKNGDTRIQPLRAQSRDALRVAMYWREKMGYTGPWILFGGGAKGTTKKTPVYTMQALYSALRRAEDHAVPRVPHLDGRAGHGFRRTVVGDVTKVTGGNAMLGLHSVGDRDARMATKYLIPRLADIRVAFDQLDRASGAEPAPRAGHREITEITPENTNGAPLKDAPLHTLKTTPK